MRVTRVQVEGLRSLHGVDIAADHAALWLQGANGAGKTSVLEALCLMGYGRSFRGRVSDGLVGKGQAELRVVVHWREASGARHVAGLEHRGDGWTARLDGAPVDRLSSLAAPFPVLAFHPQSSETVTGSAEERRRLVDWSTFHVEPAFAEASRRYARALKQRNALLRAGAPDPEFEFWEQSMDEAAVRMTQARERAVDRLVPELEALWPSLAGGAEPPLLSWRPGWKIDAALGDLLFLHRSRDRELGYTTAGPHRADLALGRPFGVEASQWSRGQAKLLALALVLAQAEAAARDGRSPVLLLDDLRAELDRVRFEAVLDRVVSRGWQAWITGTEVDMAAVARLPDLAVFHVEQGGCWPAHPGDGAFQRL
ncbi:MAG: DNA replication and repair protein RecF [Xanthomonadaceae bacterium]|jgi:DNA replication and repair protein RecF|nr:DNA replication and repair protein RecF [Xanthomonadaceae bacterium]